jgi:aerobic C4-dicarboxylate transport protein
VLRFANSLFGREVFALLIGIILGTIAPNFAVSLRPFGDGFVKLIQMII